MASLPDDFHWEPYIDGYTLRLGEVAVAIICPARDDPDAPWRIALNPRYVDMRYEFRPDEAAARSYVEAWAAKWAELLRKRYG